MDDAGYDELLDGLWREFSRMNPQAADIQTLLKSRGDQLQNDHVAFRTFDDPRVNLDVLARPFLDDGYQPKGEYAFREKKLFARHFSHPDSRRPRIFISQLKLAELEGSDRSVILGLLDQVSDETLADSRLCMAGRPWSASHRDYQQLLTHSEYAAWMLAFGFCANHFTISVNALTAVSSLAELNELLKENGFELNTVGGEIKGGPDVLLEQSSTLAAAINVKFSDGIHRIPGCYYEFARRYPTDDGSLFDGFVASSANRIFESTDSRETS